MAVQTDNPVVVDVASGVTLARQLERMTKDEMIDYADRSMGLTVDPALDVQTVKERLLVAENSRKNNARETNAQSLANTMELDRKCREHADKDKKFSYKENPMVTIRFWFMQHPGADIEFIFTDPYGFRGPRNKFGFNIADAPHYRLFHGETYVLPYAVVEHLKNQTYVTHKTIIDPATGMIGGNIPILKPRFLCEPIISKEQWVDLAKKGSVVNEAQNIQGNGAGHEGRAHKGNQYAPK